MASQTKEIEKKRNLNEICGGVSKVASSSFGSFFIKHLNLSEQSEIEEVYDDHFDLAIRNGIETEEQRKEYLAQNDLWLPSDDTKIADLKIFISGLHKTKSQLLVKRDRNDFDSQIKEKEIELARLQLKRAELIGDTAESLALKKTNELYLFYSSFEDRNCKKQRFTREEYDELDRVEIEELNHLSYSITEKFSEKGLKLIALCPAFLNFFNLCDNDPVKLYGKNVYFLTFYQIRLFSLGCYFKNILSEVGVNDDSLLDNPDKLIEKYEQLRNSKVLSHDNASGVSVVGMSKEEQKEILGHGIDIVAEVKKRGKLGLKDMMALTEG